jgi:teichuronic acid biosynthesis glycosyltransferase TuaC
MIFARRLTSTLADRGMDATTYHLDTGLTRYFGGVQRLRALLNEVQPDVVVAHFGSLTGFTAALLAGPRTVVIFRGSDLNPWTGPWLHVQTTHLLSQLSALKARHVICVSEELRNRLWHRRVDVDVMPSGVDHELFKPMDFASARTELGWDRNEKIVVFNASNRVVKRLDRALESILVAERLLGRTVRLEILSGRVDPVRIPLLMAAADCLLLVSDYEGSPTVVQEALACELPIVSVDVGDVREMLTDVSPSWIVGSNPEEIGGALADCLRLSGGTRSNGRQTMPRCSLHSIAERMEHIFKAHL